MEQAMREQREEFLQEESIQQKRGQRNRWQTLIIVSFLVAGIFLGFKEMGQSLACVLTAVFVGIAICLLHTFWRNAKISMAGLVLFVATIGLWPQGFLDLLNRGITLWNLRFGTEMIRFSVGASAKPGSYCIWGLLAFPVTLFLISQIEARRFWGPMILVMAALAFSMILGRDPSVHGTAALLLGIIGIFLSYGAFGRKVEKCGYLMILAVMGMAAVLCVTTDGYRKNPDLETWKENVHSRLEAFRYGSDTLPQGQFRKAAGLLDDKETVRLKLTMDNPQQLYLRGFMGSEYESSRWKTPDTEHYQGDYEGMLCWLKRQDFEPETQYALYEELCREAAGSTLDTTKVQVENADAYRKYVYLPAGTETWNPQSAKTVKDWQVVTGNFMGTSRYQFQVVKNMLTADQAVTADWLENGTMEKQENYRNAEAVYHSFVEDTYLEESEELKDYLQEKFFTIAGTEDPIDLTDFEAVTRQIRKVLREETSYTENPETVPENRDLIRWFLDTSRQGNAVYYATTAVMAYRTAGYPARYVEGYHLSEEAATAMEEAGETSVDLTSENAHAWVEVYLSGIGWLPVEVVPGMYTETYTDQMVAGKAAYRVNSSNSEDGLKTNQDGSKTTSDGRSADETEKKPSIFTGKHVYTFVLLLAYLGVLIYLILELQRRIRLRARRAEREKWTQTSAELVAYGLTFGERVLHSRRIKGNLSQPEEMWKEIKRKLPGIQKAEFQRFLELVQKVRFGGKELEPYEQYTLMALYRHLERCWYQSSSRFGKLVRRYYDLVEVE